LSIKKLVRDFLLNKNIRISQATDLHEIKRVISLLWPITTQHELIRLGGNGDGGYLVPDDLDGLDYCFSPGVSITANFEND
jgi:hypothetical protein